MFYEDGPGRRVNRHLPTLRGSQFNDKPCPVCTRKLSCLIWPSKRWVYSCANANCWLYQRDEQGVSEYAHYLAEANSYRAEPGREPYVPRAFDPAEWEQMPLRQALQSESYSYSDYYGDKQWSHVVPVLRIDGHEGMRRWGFLSGFGAEVTVNLSNHSTLDADTSQPTFTATLAADTPVLRFNPALKPMA